MNIYRNDFRFFKDQTIAYLDNAATSQVPDCVLDAVSSRAAEINANVHRGIHRMSSRSTEEYEQCRQLTADYLNVSKDEIVFTSGTTHSINLAARSFEESLKPGDAVVTTVSEHHSNFIPWQQLCKKTGAEFRVAGLNDNGEIDLNDLKKLLTDNVRLLAVTQCSNVTGAWTDLKTVCETAHAHGIPVLIDGAQGIAHSHPDLQDIDCDAYCFSAHKMLGLTGTGVLAAINGFMERMQPLMYGGGMVQEVRTDGIVTEDRPYALEAGTPNFIGVTALKAALQYRQSHDEAAMFALEDRLMKKLEDGLSRMPAVRILGNPKIRKGSLSFTAEGMHPFDIASLLDAKEIAVRSGHHCAMPLLQAFGCEYAVRVSPAFYNTEEEIDRFLEAMEFIVKLLGKM